MPTTLTAKGQVTVPKRVQDQLGIGLRSGADFELLPGGEISLVGADGKPPRSRFEALRGRAGAGLTTDEIMALTRGEDLG
jgi:bifunctional DNA-binding transcriptional regulator/antitoxin component of YhaV-PrlF toxin-antitoxin module